MHDPDFGTLHDLQTGPTKQFGVPYVLKVFWDRLRLSEAFQAALKDREVEVDVALCNLLMVTGRLLDPQSKRATHEWLPEIYLPELEQGAPPLHHL